MATAAPKSMRLLSVGLLLAIVLVARPARAELTTLEQEAIGVGIAAGALDVAFLTYDLVRVGQDARPHYTMALLEGLVGAQQLILGISLLASLDGGNGSTSLIAPIGAFMSLGGVVLALHGYWGLQHPAAPQVAVAPVPGGGIVTLGGRF